MNHSSTYLCSIQSIAIGLIYHCGILHYNADIAADKLALLDSLDVEDDIEFFESFFSFKEDWHTPSSPSNEADTCHQSLPAVVSNTRTDLQQINSIIDANDDEARKKKRKVRDVPSHLGPFSSSHGTTGSNDDDTDGWMIQEKRQKSKRGPKPKYIFQTEEEAATARRERNRKAALKSYYRKRNKIEDLEQEIARLEQENADLDTLLQKIERGEKDVLKRASDDGIDAWLLSRESGEERAVS